MASEHICPSCNREVEDPDYAQPECADPLLGSMPWQDRLGDENAVLEPVCPCGNRMRNLIIGEYRVLSPLVSALRAAFLSFCVILIAAAIDSRAVPIALIGFGACGAYALWTGLLWAGQAGSVARLAPRAYGVAVGLISPALAYTIAVRLGWAVDFSLLDPLVKLVTK